MRAPTDLPVDIPSLVADILAQIPARAPRVHCITNAVAQNFTANMLLALGGVPSMTIARDEIDDFVARADALLINLGTLDPERRAAVDRAVRVAVSRAPTHMRWVLDPVLIDRSAPRRALAAAIASRRPCAIRLNGAEFRALAGVEPTAETLARYAAGQASVIGLTGDRDVVADGERMVAILNGDPLMARVTAMGCAASAVVAACHAVEPDPWLATAAGLLLMGIAGEVAAKSARGPGSFAVAMLDALHGLDAATIAQRARVER
jgi:hydroxyethylthiazole kinase